MKLKQNKKVVFEPLTHTYLCGEVLLKGITTLMKEQGLSVDYSGTSEEVLEKAREKGKALHEMLEAYDNGEAVVSSKELDSYKNLGLQVVCSEYLVSDNKTVASSIDKVLYVDEETVDLADVKRTSDFHQNSVSWQLSIYKYLFEKQNKGIRVRNLYGIHFKNDKCKLIQVEAVPEEAVKEVLDCNRKGTLYSNPDLAPEAPEASLILTEEEQGQLVSCTMAIDELKQTIKGMEAVVEEISGKLITYMQSNHLAEMSAGDITIKLKDSYSKQTVDSKGLRAKYPEIAEEFTRTSTVKASLIYKQNNK